MEGKAMNETAQPVLPVIHLNGTSREALIQDRVKVGRAVNAALEALMQACPNGRDYYPVDGLMQRAMAQHERRVAVLRGLIAEIYAEIDGIDEARQ
jgi:hypothetical protein